MKWTDDVHIRLIISRGDKITPYQNPNANVGPINFVIIPEYKKTDPKIYENGITIGRVSTIRPSENILSTHYNTLSKLNCILASIEANKLKYDEGIMNDPNGNISTCNSTNLFFIKKVKFGPQLENFVSMELLEVKQFIYVIKMKFLVLKKTLLLRILKIVKKLLLQVHLQELYLYQKSKSIN